VSSTAAQHSVASAQAAAAAAAAAAVDDDSSSVTAGLPESAQRGRLPLSLPPLVRNGSTASSSGAPRPAATSMLLSRRK
jgi:hypothetical protein